MEAAILNWLSRVAADSSIPAYGFRVALRLASKVTDGGLQTRIQKCRSAADTAAIAALLNAGLLSEASGPSRRETYLQIEEGK